LTAQLARYEGLAVYGEVFAIVCFSDLWPHHDMTGKNVQHAIGGSHHRIRQGAVCTE
jgi:hypothetical protein